MEEIWKDVPGYEGIYQVSSIGRVRSLDRTITYKDKRSRFYHGRIIDPNFDAYGYQTFIFSHNRRTKHYKIHRLVALLFIPNPESTPEVNHIDGDKSNNNINNLEWVTSRENKLHAIHHGLSQPERNLKIKRGIQCYNAKTMIIFKDGIEVKRYSPLCEAEKDGFRLVNVRKQSQRGKKYKGFDIIILDHAEKTY